MTKTLTRDVVVSAICQPFTCEGRRLHRLRVAADGTVTVWDSVAGHYTTVHSLTARSMGRIRALARAKLAAE